MKVEPAQLNSAAASVDVIRTELRTLHDTAHSTAELALGGWAGASAHALTRSLGRWVASSDVLEVSLVEHHDGLTAAAHLFPATDAANSRALDL